MSKTRILIISVLALTLSFASGCTDRADNGTGAEQLVIAEGAPMPKIHVFFNELILQIRNEYQLLHYVVYAPPEVVADMKMGLRPKSVPLLILLPPQGEDRNYYIDHGLLEIADELIAKDLIKPMAIATISNDPVFGGYFYAGDSTRLAVGNWDALIGDALVVHLQEFFPFILRDSTKRGIGGVGMGAYGAFRAAINHPSVFASVSAVDGPLDFDGADGESGLINLMDTVFAEQLAKRADFPLDSTWVHAYDSSSECPVSRMFIGGALAFSPHDTLIYYTIEWPNKPVIDTSMRGKIGTIITDSTTLVDSIVNFDAHNFDFHLPFNYDGEPYDLIWNMWLPHNLENLLSPSGDELAGTKIWVGTSKQARYGYYTMTEAWVTTLEERGLDSNVTVMEYTGSSESPATGGQYIYDLLHEILIFHSNSFYPNGSND